MQGIKEIECYRCGKKGIAVGVGKKVDKNWASGWSAEGFKPISPKWLCNECNSFRCESCHILLSNDHKCKCGMKHGEYTKESLPLCKWCFEALSIKDHE